MTPEQRTADDPRVPLYSDLDGTIIWGQTTARCVALLPLQRPWLVPVAPLYLLGGRARFKHFVAGSVRFDPERLEYREDVLTFLKAQRRGGRRIILATAANEKI